LLSVSLGVKIIIAEDGLGSGRRKKKRRRRKRRRRRRRRRRRKKRWWQMSNCQNTSQPQHRHCLQWPMISKNLQMSHGMLVCVCV